MFQLLSKISKMELFVRQLPCLLFAFVVASAFYRFGSFALECIGFLATWFLIDALVSLGAWARETFVATRTAADVEIRQAAHD